MTKDSVDDEVKVQIAPTPPIKDLLNDTNQDTMVTLEKTHTEKEETKDDDKKDGSNEK